MKNIQVKEKEQTMEVLKKIGNISGFDSRIHAIVAHYERNLEKKDKYIAQLQKKIKENYYSNAKNTQHQ